MNPVTFGGLWLRLQLAVRANPLVAAAALVCLACLVALAWTVHVVAGLEAERDALKAAAARIASVPSPVPVLPSAPPAQPAAQSLDPLDAFYAALGPRRYAGQQVKTLFALAAKNGLSLSQGEYKSGYDSNARVSTYQVNLPVKGSYAAIWQFALGALSAIPFASLDDISFRRDGIQDPTVEARLRLTLYLKDVPGDAP
jgi:type VI protein secretion system component VasK